MIVFGAVATGATSKKPGILLILSSIAGAIFGGTLVAIFMALSLIGGILVTMGAKKPNGSVGALAGDGIEAGNQDKQGSITEDIIKKGKETLDSIKPIYEKVVAEHANTGENVTDTLGDMASTLGSRISDISHAAKEKSKEIFENFSEKKTATERLEELQKLRSGGVITEEEFQEKKRQVLSDL